MTVSCDNDKYCKTREVTKQGCYAVDLGQVSQRLTLEMAQRFSGLWPPILFFQLFILDTRPVLPASRSNATFQNHHKWQVIYLISYDIIWYQRIHWHSHSPSRSPPIFRWQRQKFSLLNTLNTLCFISKLIIVWTFFGGPRSWEIPKFSSPKLVRTSQGTTETPQAPHRSVPAGTAWYLSGGLRMVQSDRNGCRLERFIYFYRVLIGFYRMFMGS